MIETNGTLEDVCAEIGFTATMRLVALRPGETIYVPVEYAPGHDLARMIGESRMARLVAAYGGEKFDVPTLSDFDNMRLLPGLARRISAGESVRAIAAVFGLTDRHVRRLRTQAEDLGLLSMVFRRVGEKE